MATLAPSTQNTPTTATRSRQSWTRVLSKRSPTRLGHSHSRWPVTPANVFPSQGKMEMGSQPWGPVEAPPTHQTTNATAAWTVRVAAVLFLLVLAGDAGASFGGRGLISTPTADVLPRGMFVAALTGGYRAEDPFDRTGAALAFDLGLGRRLQGGASWSAASAPDAATLSWDARALVLRQDGALPNVSIAAAELGEGKEHAVGLALVSKEFNLPSAGFFQLHAGVKIPLYPDASDADIKPIGGIEKTWYALSRDWRGIAEWDGDAFSVGVEQRFREGLRVGVAFETDTPRVLFAVGFANEPIVTEIDNAKRLAKQAARLATRPADAPPVTPKEDGK